ncbi:fosfomycin resistance glutathione transferase [Thalassospira sp. TSL5-1]|uniref:fosfomycin resistance glutathione transferase n=1 Tax=Thalassospira sp. TSL5-1 TaxID=1544451 RepID=UPI00093CFC3C|nr:fosfomycin resistance glutathione transferase [Thalassospira sp. TSL5-1]
MIRGLNHITFATRDLAGSFAFYTGVLGARPLARWDEGAYLLLGDVWLCLSLDPQSLPPATSYTHLAFDVDPADFAAMRQKLHDAGAREWKTNRSEGASVYFLDPDGHRLELHEGNWQSRLDHYRQNPPPGMVFYDTVETPIVPDASPQTEK